MRHYCKVLTFERRQSEDAAYGGQLLTRIAAHDARLSEQSLDGSIAAGQCARVAGGSPATALAGACLDGCDATSLANEAGSMKQQLVGIGDVLDIEEFYARVTFSVKVIVHVLQHVLNANLLAVAYRPYAVEL